MTHNIFNTKENMPGSELQLKMTTPKLSQLRNITTQVISLRFGLWSLLPAVLLHLELIAACVLSVQKKVKQSMHFIATSCTNIKREKVASFNFFHASISATLSLCSLLLVTNWCRLSFISQISSFRINSFKFQITFFDKMSSVWSGSKMCMTPSRTGQIFLP